MGILKGDVGIEGGMWLLKEGCGYSMTHDTQTYTSGIYRHIFNRG